MRYYANPRTFYPSPSLPISVDLLFLTLTASFAAAAPLRPQ